MTTEIQIYITGEYALGGCDPEGIDVEATRDKFVQMYQSALAAAYPDAVVVVEPWTEYALSATRTPRYRVVLDEPGREEEMEADVQRICEDTWERQEHWVEIVAEATGKESA